MGGHGLLALLLLSLLLLLLLHTMWSPQSSFFLWTLYTPKFKKFHWNTWNHSSFINYPAYTVITDNKLVRKLWRKRETIDPPASSRHLLNAHNNTFGHNAAATCGSSNCCGAEPASGCACRRHTVCGPGGRGRLVMKGGIRRRSGLAAATATIGRRGRAPQRRWQRDRIPSPRDK